MNNIKKNKIKTLSLVFFILTFSFAIFVYIFYDFQKQRLDNIKNNYTEKINNSYKKNIELHLKNYYTTELENFINDEILEAVYEQNREKLLNLTQKAYQKLKNDDHYIDILHFHLANGKTLLRLHNPKMYDDDIAKKRVMLSQIHKEHQVLNNFELGVHGFSFRNIIPLFYKEKYIGAVEIGVSPKKVLDLVTRFNETDGIIRFNTQKGINIYKNVKNPTVAKIIEQEDSNIGLGEVFNLDDKYFGVYSFDITDSNGDFIAEFIFFQELTPNFNDFYSAIKKMLLIFIIGLFFASIIIAYIFELFSRNIAKLSSKAQTILNAQNNIVIVTNNGVEIVEVNKAFYDFLEFKNLKDFKKKYRCICDFFIPSDGYLKSNMDDMTWISYILKNPKKIHLAKMKKNNHIHIFRLNANIIDSDEEDNTQVVVTFEDITHEIESNQLLEKERDLFTQGPVLLIQWSPKKNWPIVYVSKNCSKVLGYSQEEMQNEDFVYAELIHPDDKEKIFNEVTYNIKNQINSYEQSYRLRLKNGEYRWFYDFTNIIRNEIGTVISIRGYMFEQTQLKNIEKELELQKKQLENIIEGTNVGTWEWEVQTGKTTFNEKWAEMIGYSLDEITPTTIDTWLQFAHPDDLVKSGEKLEACFKKQNEFYEIKCRMRHKNGEWIWVFDKGKVTQWSKDGQTPILMSGTHTNIDYEERLKHRLEKDEEMFKELFNNMKSGVVIYEAYNNAEDFIFRDINKTSQLMDNINKDDIIGKKVTEIFPGVIEMGLFDVLKRVYKTGLAEELPISFYKDDKLSMYRKNFVYSLSSGEVIAIYDDITNEIQNQEALKYSEQRFQDIIQASDEYVWEVDLDGKYTYLTQQFEIMTGMKIEEALGKTPFDFMPDFEARRVFVEFNNAVKEKKEFKNLEHCSKRNDGKIVWQKVSGIPVFTHDGVLKSYRGAALDITKQIEANNTILESNRFLEESLLKVKEANQAKSQFLANMSHEIRTPMNAIIGITELMFDTSIDDKQKDYLSKIQSSSKMLLAIINDILDYSKIEAGKLVLERKSFDLSNVFTQLRILFSNLSSKKDLELYFYMKNDVPGVIVGDELRLDQVLTNLLSNALKFTHHGMVVLKIELIKKISDKQALLGFSIEDTGIGMTKQEVAKLFTPFTQTDSSTTRKYGGTGLGLSICKKIVETMDGEVQVQSQKNKGTTFSFELLTEVTSWNQSYKNIEINKLRFLVVDDQEISLIILKEMIENFGGEAVLASNAKEALEILKESDKKNELFDFILMDWMMPEINGKEAIKTIYEKYENSELKHRPPSILMVSAHSKNEIDLEGVEIDNFLSKPVTSSTLFDAISQVKKGLVKKSSPIINKDLPDLKGINILLVEDNIINQEVASMMLTKVGATITIANNGQEAVDMYLKNPKSFCIILMDLQMPIMSGYDATKIIREHDKNIPIIALTAAAMVEDKKKVIEAGMNDHLSKPIDSDEMYKVIAQNCRVKFSLKKEKDKQNNKNQIIDMDFLRRNLNSQSLIQKLLTKFSEQLNDEFKDIVNEVKNNTTNAPSLIHALKGVSVNLGAKALFELCKDIDENYKNKKEVSSKYIKDLEISIENLKVELNKNIKIDTEKEKKVYRHEDYTNTIKEIQDALKNSSIIKNELLEEFYSFIEEKMNKNDFEKLKRLIDDFEYESVIDLLKNNHII